MKSFLFQIIFLALIIFVCNSVQSAYLDLPAAPVRYDVKVKRFLNPRFGFKPDREQLRLMAKYFKGQDIKQKKDEEKKSRLYRQHLASRVMGSFIRDFNTMRY